MKKALIFYGGWDGHEPLQVGERFENILKSQGFEVSRFDHQECLDDGEALRGLDLIVPIWTMGEITRERCQNVMKAVEGGVGIAGCHGGMCDAFRNSVDWQFMTGGNWVSHPGNDGVTYEVEIGEGELLQGLEDFEVTSEQYYLHVDPAVKVLATTPFPKAEGPHTVNGPVDMPVVWTKGWGKGKVFYNALGHHADIFDHPTSHEIMRRGFLWAANAN